VLSADLVVDVRAVCSQVSNIVAEDSVLFAFLAEWEAIGEEKRVSCLSCT